MDPDFQPIWHQGIMSRGMITFRTELIDDNIGFAFQGKGRFTFQGTEYIITGLGQVFLGVFSQEGDLENLQVTDASNGVELNEFKVDNCQNLLIDGDFRGISQFGNDTLSTGDEYLYFLAKNSRVNPVPINMPEDTANCDPFILYAPEGHLYYKWNEELSDQNYFG